ncbi:MAG: outer membrane beta-barrel protein [Bacteroidales bacterium]|nr:outer membrane beta-barrel protein [Bacteroidales bacterium]
MRKNYIIALLLALVLCGSATAQRYNPNSIKRANNKEQIRLGVRCGLNLGDMTSASGLDVWNGLAFFDINSNYIGFTDTKPFKLGLNFGIVAQSHFFNKENLFWQGSFIYTTKGYKLNTQDVEIDATAAYMQIPLELIYKFPAKNASFLVSAGAFLGAGVYGFTDFEDHYGENDDPRSSHAALHEPYINEALGTTNLIGCDYSVHGANVYWKDKDDTFESEGTWRWDAGLQVGVGVEYWRLQFMITYQYSLTPFYDYGHDFSYRYQQRGEDYHTSFEYFNLKDIKSPRQQMVSFTISYFFDNFQHGIRL